MEKLYIFLLCPNFESAPLPSFNPFITQELKYLYVERTEEWHSKEPLKQNIEELFHIDNFFVFVNVFWGGQMANLFIAYSKKGFLWCYSASFQLLPRLGVFQAVMCNTSICPVIWLEQFAFPLWPQVSCTAWHLVQKSLPMIYELLTNHVPIIFACNVNKA